MFELISEVHKMKRFMGILVEEEQTPDSINRYAQNIPYEGKNEEFLNKEFPEALTVLRPE
jgi:hypothetical protein